MIFLGLFQHHFLINIIPFYRLKNVYDKFRDISNTIFLYTLYCITDSSTKRHMIFLVVFRFQFSCWLPFYLFQKLEKTLYYDILGTFFCLYRMKFNRLHDIVLEFEKQLFSIPDIVLPVATARKKFVMTIFVAFPIPIILLYQIPFYRFQKLF